MRRDCSHWSRAPRSRLESGAERLARETNIRRRLRETEHVGLLEHERGLGGWQAEAATIAAVIQATGSALSSIADAVSGLSVDTERMAANVAATSGVIFAERAMMLLAPTLGREAALRIVEDAIKGARDGQRTFAQALSSHAEAVRAIPPGDLASMESPDAYLGAADEFRRRLLAQGDSPRNL